MASRYVEAYQKKFPNDLLIGSRNMAVGGEFLHANNAFLLRIGNDTWSGKFLYYLLDIFI